jgi:deoxyribonuclease-4
MYFGAHVSASGGIHNAVQRAVDIGADAVQVFTQSPRMWRPIKHPDENVAAFREAREQHLPGGAVAHAIYLINIASDDPELRAKSTTALAQTMEIGGRLGLDAVVFHPGSHKGSEAGLDGCIDEMVRSIHAALDATDTTWLLLENSAGQGGTIGRDIEELARLFHAVDHPRLGVCLDTCHWFVSGVDVTDPGVLDAKLAELDDAIGLERLRCLHLNDSKAPLGSNRDRHENVGDGELGEGLGTFLGHPKLQHLTAYLEVPGEGDGPTADELDKARAIRERALAGAGAR